MVYLFYFSQNYAISNSVYKSLFFSTGSKSAADWEKMAKQWASRQREQQQSTPGPDSTPLIDEH